VQTQFTAEAFFNVSSAPANTVISLVSQWDNFNNQLGWVFAVKNENSKLGLRLSVSQNSTTVIATNAQRWSLSANKDYYAAVTFNAGTITFYLADLSSTNPILESYTVVNSIVTNVFNTPADFRVGAWGSSTTDFGLTYFTGLIDEVRVSRVALAPASFLYPPQASPSATLTSSATPAGYKDSLTYTNTLPVAATGSVLFQTNSVLFSSNNLSGGIAVSLTITNLPRGTNLITAIFSGDSNYLPSTNTLNQIVTNHPPVAGVMTVYRTGNLRLKIALSDVAANWTDSDGDLVSLTNVVMQSTNGINLYALNWTTNSGYIATATNAYIGYVNTNITNDQVTYSISDGQGGTSVGLVNIMVNPFVTGQDPTLTVTGGTATVNFAGIPGYSYSVQRTTNLVDWVTIWTTNAPAKGVFDYTDNFSDLGVIPSSAEYRLKWQP